MAASSSVSQPLTVACFELSLLFPFVLNLHGNGPDIQSTRLEMDGWKKLLAKESVIGHRVAAWCVSVLVSALILQFAYRREPSVRCIAIQFAVQSFSVSRSHQTHRLNIPR